MSNLSDDDLDRIEADYRFGSDVSAGIVMSLVGEVRRLRAERNAAERVVELLLADQESDDGKQG